MAWGQTSDSPVTTSSSNVEGAAFSPDGSWYAVITEGSTGAYVYKTSDWSEVTSLSKSGYSSGANEVAFGPNSDYIALADNDVGVAVWQTSDWTEISDSPIKTDGFTDSVNFSPDGNHIASADSYNDCRVWQTSDWTEISDSPVASSSSNLETTSWTSDSSRLAVGGDAGEVYVVDTSNWSEISSSPINTGSIDQIDYSRNDDYLGVGKSANEALVLDTSDWSTVTSKTVFGNDVEGIGWADADNYFVAGSLDDDTRIYDTSDWSEITESPLQDIGDNVKSIEFNSGASVFAVAGDPSKVYLYNAETAVQTITGSSTLAGQSVFTATIPDSKISEFNRKKELDVASVTGTPSVSRTLPIKIISGDDSITGTGEIVLDWTNISSKSDIAIFDENDNLLDYHIESFDATAETATIHVYRSWTRDGSTQAVVAYGNGPTDESVSSSTVFDSESNLEAGWLLNESSGDALDVTSNNNDGTVTGGYGASGPVNGAYDMAGTEEVEVSSPTFGGSSEFTMEVWVNADSTDIDSAIMGTKEGNSSKDRSTGIRYDSTGYASGNNEVLKFAIRNQSGTYTNYETEANQQKSSAQHIVLTWQSGNDPVLYTDSTTVSIASSNGDPVSGSISTPSWYLGSGIRSDDGFWQGLLDDSRIYSTSLGSDDIEARFDATKDSPDFFSQKAGTSTASTITGIAGANGTSVLTPVGTDVNLGASNSSATSTFSSVGTSVFTTSSTLNASSSFVSEGTLEFNGISTLNSSSTVSSDASLVRYALSSPSASASVSSIGTDVKFGVLDVASSSTVSSEGTPVILGISSPLGSSDINIYSGAKGVALLDASSDVTAVGEPVFTGKIVMDGTSSVTSVPSFVYYGDLDIEGSGDVDPFLPEILFNEWRSLNDGSNI